MNEMHNDDQALQEMLEPVTEQSEQVEEQSVEHSPEERIEDAKPTPEQSFRALREKAEREAERAERAERRYQELMEAKESARAQQEKEPEYADDDIAEQRHLRKMQAQYDSKLQEMGARLEQITVEARIKQQFPDFDNVVNSDSVAALAKKKPGIAKIIGQTNDLYSQAEAAYDLIKTYGLAPNPQMDNLRARAEANSKKPHVGNSAPAPAKSPGTFDFADRIASGEMTPDMEQYLRDEIEKNSRKLY